ncbi:hypothetical protein [Janthinobacterium sp. 67]|uniref:hypothetical protein n=1 Tax=Janthinobacterium sp. 67 TaxID=2035207 RepID=UPI0018E27042|nr:hypothetical protein [Janthinobacterium sp. 67]
MCVQTWLNVLMAVNKGCSFLLNSLILDLDSNDSHLQKKVKYFNWIHRLKLWVEKYQLSLLWAHPTPGGRKGEGEALRQGMALRM